MDKSATQNTDKKKKFYGYACCAVGCGMPCLFVLTLLLTFIYSVNYEDFGENMATSPMYYTEKGNNFCYDLTFLNRYFEFTISEQDFLDWCKDRDERYRWEPIEIQILPSLPTSNKDRNDDSVWPIINEKRGSKIPLSITRYNHRKTQHEQCPRWKECQIDPTGKTDDACFRLVGDGYYFELRGSNGGGVYILYDRERNRCYIEYHRW